MVEAARKEKKGATTQESYNQLSCYLSKNTQEFRKCITQVPRMEKKKKLEKKALTNQKLIL